MKTINYYPAAGGWSLMWENFDPQVIDQDFAKIASLNADTVRVIVQPGAIGGWPVPGIALANVAATVGIAGQHGLRVHLTLFDQYPKAFVDIAGSKRWASGVLAAFGGDPAIACVELHNEVDPTNPTVMAWVKAMLPYVRKVGGHPVTVSIKDKTTTTDSQIGVDYFKLLVKNLAPVVPDFWSPHYYGSAAQATTVLKGFKAVAKGLPIFIGETGDSTFIVSELTQANYYRYIGAICAKLELPPPAPWILNDFTPIGIPNGPGSGKEYGFGLYRADGTAKPSADAVRLIFTTTRGGA